MQWDILRKSPTSLLCEKIKSPTHSLTRTQKPKSHPNSVSSVALFPSFLQNRHTIKAFTMCLMSLMGGFEELIVFVVTVQLLPPSMFRSVKTTALIYFILLIRLSLWLSLWLSLLVHLLLLFLLLFLLLLLLPLLLLHNFLLHNLFFLLCMCRAYLVSGRYSFCVESKP